MREWDRVAECRKPLIAAVAGYALGGGCEIAMMCDIILAADTAKFGQPEITLGIIPGAGGTQRLARMVGKAKAMELCLTGRLIGAEEAERAGLVSRIVPAAELVDEAMRIAEKIASFPLAAVMMVKESRQPRRRDVACGGPALRAPALPRALRDRGPEGGDGARSWRSGRRSSAGAEPGSRAPFS